MAARVDEIDGRDLLIGERWLIDFSSPCHLGLDLDEELIDAVTGYVARWGVHAPWSRVSALHEELEAALGRLLGSPRPLLAASIDRLHLTAVPAFAAGGTVFLDAGAGRPLSDAVAVAHGAGASVVPFDRGESDRLAALLAGAWRRPGLICVEAVDRLTGTPAPLGELAALARGSGALLYVDDSVSFGVLGEHSPFQPSPYGIRGNGAVAHFNAGGDEVVIVASLERACASEAAFLACAEPLLEVLKREGDPATLRPGVVPALATAIEGLRINERRGDRIRARLHRLSEQVGAAGGFPILPLATNAAASLSEHGIHALRGGPDRSPVIHVTAAHTDEQIAALKRALAKPGASFKLRSVPAE